MPWNSTAPVGSISVKANRIILQQNTTYTEDSMGNSAVGTNTVATRDHFWNVGADEDGRHRFMQSPGFTVGGNAADPVLGTGMDGVLYVKEVNSDVGRVEGFYRNTQGIYKYIPSFLSGTHVVTGSYTNMVTVPPNVYGEIFMIGPTAGNHRGQVGFFKSTATVCDAWAYDLDIQGGGNTNLTFGNGSDASGLNIRVIINTASPGLTWSYRIVYRAL